MSSSSSCKCLPNVGDPYVQVSSCAEDKSQSSIIYPPDALTKPTLTRSVRSVLRGSHGSTGGKSFSGLKPIKTRLFSNTQNSSSAAASALTLNVGVAFNTATFPEIQSYALLYDECRVLGVKIHHHCWPSIEGAAGTFSSGARAIGFDPSVGNVTTINGVMEETYHTGPFIICPGLVNGRESLMSMTKYSSLSAKPPAALAPITSSDCPGKAWFCVDGATAPIIFQYIGYNSALGAAGVISDTCFYELDVEFRLRT